MQRENGPRTAPGTLPHHARQPPPASPDPVGLPTRSVLERPRNPSKATVLLLEDERGRRVRKQLQDLPPSRLWRVGRRMLQREIRMLRAVQGLACVPRLLEAGETWYEMEHVEGETLASRRELGIDAEEGRRILAAMRAFHRGGFAHGDLGRRDVVLASDGRVVFLDFATCVGPGHPRLLWRPLRRWARRHDRKRLRAVVSKARARYELWREEQEACAWGRADVT